MCGIAGFFNSAGAVGRTRKALAAMGHRGRDGAGIAVHGNVFFAKKPIGIKAEESENALGHVLHSVVGSVRQPLKGTGFLAANCEIYNWKELCKKHGIRAENDAGLLLRLIEGGERGICSVLDELDGVWALAYWEGSRVFLSRDILGEKPLWYSLENGLCFASERKALEAAGCGAALELGPRHVLVFDLEKNRAEFIEREFLGVKRRELEFGEAKKQLAGLLERAVGKRIPEREFGLLFSGGIDSVLLAAVFKKMGLEFRGYFGFVEGIGKPKDLEFAKSAAEALGFELEAVPVKLEEVPGLLKEIVPLIESSNPVKVSVGLPLLVACRKAGEHGIKVMFSGLGADELFCGYARFRESNSVALDSRNLLLQMHENDLYRDDVIAMSSGMELRLPFLDLGVTGFALSLNDEFKIRGERNKIILREAAAEFGIGKRFAERKKTAAQYGSNFDKAVAKLAKRAGAKGKSAYLKRFSGKKNLKVAALFSGGKDSCLALWIMQRQDYEIGCLVSVLPENPDSFMYHKPDPNLLKLQAEAMGIPLIIESTKGEKEEELETLGEALRRAKEEFGIQGVVSGALYSNYQRERIQEICSRLQLRLFSPLWHKKQEEELRELVGSGFEFIIVKVAAQGLGMEWLGRRIGRGEIEELIVLAEKHGFNPAGEGGEFESLVLDGPNFRKRLKIEFEKIPSGEHTGHIEIRKAELAGK